MQTRRTLYLAIVRCHLGYATQVWSPQSVGLLKQVESVQRRATKYILKLPFRTDIAYKTRLQLTNLIPLRYYNSLRNGRDVFFFSRPSRRALLILRARLAFTPARVKKRKKK